MECDNENTQERFSDSDEEGKAVLITDPESKEEM